MFLYFTDEPVILAGVVVLVGLFGLAYCVLYGLEALDKQACIDTEERLIAECEDLPVVHQYRPYQRVVGMAPMERQQSFTEWHRTEEYRYHASQFVDEKV